jgi:4-amino-4-deoxy-L-arabinose transferase-like glycosyltransferase
MATAPKIKPPFYWLGPYAEIAGLIGVVAAGAFFRFWQLGSLPPGLYNTAAATGLQALNLAERGWLPGLNAANSYAPLWVWLQAISVKLLGHTPLALRLWPALLGTLAVLTTWMWLKSWFGLRVAWLGAFLMAVTPWAVTLTRDGSVAALFPFLVTLTLWLATRAYRENTLKTQAMLAGVLLLDLLSGPLGWWVAAVVMVAGLIGLASRHRLAKLDRPRMVFALGLGAALALVAYLAGISLTALRALPADLGFTGSITTLGGNLVRTLLMFNVTGDDNYRHNLAAEPMLNVFVGLMLVAGLLVSISRLHQRRYKLLLGLSAAMLVPAIVSTHDIPNAAHAVALMPLIFALCAIGISYMLELWYATFPINSAARVTGQAAIILLLALTLFQGYTQYFRAWAGSAQVYAAYDEDAVAISHYMATKPFTGQRFVVVPDDQLPVVAYLSHKGPAYQPIRPSDIVSLPATPGGRQFLIAAASRDEAVRELKLKFSGGVLRPGYSSLNFAEIYYVYEVHQ